jgi:hypothetical protein
MIGDGLPHLVGVNLWAAALATLLPALGVAMVFIPQTPSVQGGESLVLTLLRVLAADVPPAHAAAMAPILAALSAKDLDSHAGSTAGRYRTAPGSGPDRADRDGVGHDPGSDAGLACRVRHHPGRGDHRNGPDRRRRRRPGLCRVASLHRRQRADLMPEEIRAEIGRPRGIGWTIDQIPEHLHGLLDRAPCRSALGRHIKGMDALGEKMRQSSQVNEVAARSPVMAKPVRPGTGTTQVAL